MGDYIVRATAGDGQIRAFAVDSRETVEAARKRHDTSPVVTAALGRLLARCSSMVVLPTCRGPVTRRTGYCAAICSSNRSM